MWQRRCGSIWWGWRQREAVLGSHGQVGGGAAMARSRWSLASSELSVIPVRRGERRCFPGDAGLGFLRGEAGLIVARSFLGVGDGRRGQSWTWPEVLVGCGPSCRLGVDVWPRFPYRVVGRWSSAMHLLRQVLRWRRCEASWQCYQSHGGVAMGEARMKILHGFCRAGGDGICGCHSPPWRHRRACSPHPSRSRCWWMSPGESLDSMF